MTLMSTHSDTCIIIIIIMRVIIIVVVVVIIIIIVIIIVIIIIIMAYIAAFPQSGSSSAGIEVISTSDIGQASNTGEIPLLFSRSAVGSLKSPILG